MNDLSVFFGLFLTAFLLRTKLQPKWLVKRVLESYCEYRQTGPMMAVNEPAFYTVERDSTKTLSENIDWGNIELRLSGVGDEMRPFIDALSANPKAFFLDQVDYIVLSKQGMQNVMIKPPKHHQHFGRSLFLEITVPRATLFLSFTLLNFVASLALSASRSTILGA